MADDENDTPAGFPGGYVRILGDVVGDGDVRPRADPPRPVPTPGAGPTRDSNRVFTGDEMEAAFGRHPWADWKPVIRRRRRRR